MVSIPAHALDDNYCDDLISRRRDFGKLDKLKKFEQNSVLNLDTIERFTQNDLVRRTGLISKIPIQCSHAVQLEHEIRPSPLRECAGTTQGTF